MVYPRDAPDHNVHPDHAAVVDYEGPHLTYGGHLEGLRTNSRSGGLIKLHCT